MKKFINIFFVMLLMLGTAQSYNGLTAYEVAAAPAVKTAEVSAPVEVSSLEVVKNPNKYLNKTIIMKATFDKFSTLGLNYKPAMRSSENYIGILIRRDDVFDHTIPLSEMKMFLKRDLAEKNINLESNDKILITGKVFSAALGDPWVDITEIKVIQKAPKAEDKK